MNLKNAAEIKNKIKKGEYRELITDLVANLSSWCCLFDPADILFEVSMATPRL